MGMRYGMGGCGPRDGLGGGWERWAADAGRRFEQAFGEGSQWERRAARMEARFGDAFGHGRGGGGGRGRRVVDGGELRLLLLKLIADEPRHGYELIRAIEAMTAGAYAPSPGMVYPALSMMDEMGQVAEQRTEGARKRFALTDEGRAELERRREEADALAARLAALGERRERSDAAPIRRAMANLGTAVRGRLARGEFSEETLHDVAAMLDEVAQKIERLR